LIWFIVNQIRKFYKVVEAKRQRAQETNADESEDEDDEHEADEDDEHLLDMGKSETARKLDGKETVMEIEKDNTTN
jgi:hypothetical protein